MARSEAPVPMREALGPEEQKSMRLFLWVLVVSHHLSRRHGVEFDAGAVMKFFIKERTPKRQSRMRINAPPEVVGEIKRLRDGGLTYGEISREVGKSRAWVNKVALTYKVGGLKDAKNRVAAAAVRKPLL